MNGVREREEYAARVRGCLLGVAIALEDDLTYAMNRADDLRIADSFSRASR